MNHLEILEKIYNNALQEIAENNYSTNLSKEISTYIERIISHSEVNKGIATVLVTLLTHKLVDPNQDIRHHQAQLENGF